MKYKYLCQSFLASLEQALEIECRYIDKEGYDISHKDRVPPEEPTKIYSLNDLAYFKGKDNVDLDEAVRRCNILLSEIRVIKSYMNKNKECYNDELLKLNEAFPKVVELMSMGDYPDNIDEQRSKEKRFYQKLWETEKNRLKAYAEEIDYSYSDLYVSLIDAMYRIEGKTPVR